MIVFTPVGSDFGVSHPIATKFCVVFWDLSTMLLEFGSCTAYEALKKNWSRSNDFYWLILNFGWKGDMLPLDFTYWLDIKLSTLCGNDATKDEKPLAALDDYVSLAFTIPDISQESSGPIITSLLMPGVSAIFCFMIAKVFLEITWKLLSEFLSGACFNFRLFLKNDIFLPTI